ncbi:MAG: ribosome silencing factor [Bacilli bacterium]|nr:ribosome silencing factor [Bacilli bacterium]
MNEKDLLKLIKKSILDKKGEKVEVIDVRAITPFTNYYVICSASNPRQIDAIKDAVVDSLSQNKVKINHVEGKAKSGWVLVDAFHVIINVFSKNERERFNLTQILTRKK